MFRKVHRMISFDEIVIGIDNEDIFKACFKEIHKYMVQKHWLGACHATTAVLYAICKVLGIESKPCIGEVLKKKFFDHSWLVINGHVFDLAIAMPLENVFETGPIYADYDLKTGEKTDVIYGVKHEGLDERASVIYSQSIYNYLKNSPEPNLIKLIVDTLKLNGVYTSRKRLETLLGDDGWEFVEKMPGSKSAEELQIGEYRQLLESMDALCDKVPETIYLNYFDSNKYLYSLYVEAFDSIKGFCVLLENGTLISQACTVLRMAIENTATICVLEMHKELLPKYIDHQRFRFENRNEDNEKKKELIKKHFQGKCDFKKDNPFNFLEYGWFKSLDENYGLDSLIELSKIQEQDDAIKNWKNVLNQWTHGIIKEPNLLIDIDAGILYTHRLILIAAKLLDILVVYFHNENGFNFVFEGLDYRKTFLDAYKEVAS